MLSNRVDENNCHVIDSSTGTLSPFRSRRRCVMQQRNTVTAQGRSGRTYTFNEYPVGTEFKPIGGVYMFLKDRDPIYVGQTGDLSERFEDHHKAASIRRRGANRVCVLAERSEAQRLAIEGDILANYNWPANG
jgi:hypothetical protein